MSNNSQPLPCETTSENRPYVPITTSSCAREHRRGECSAPGGGEAPFICGEMRTNAETVSALVALDDATIDGGGARAETGTRTAAPTSHESNGIIKTPATAIDSELRLSK